MNIIDCGYPAAQATVRPIAARSSPPASRQTLAGLRAEWRRLARLLDDPAVELDPDTVTPLLLCYERMTAAGLRIDAMAQALVRQLSYQLAASETFLDG